MVIHSTFRVWDKTRSEFLYSDGNGYFFDRYNKVFVIDGHKSLIYLDNMSTPDNCVLQEFLGFTDKNDQPVYEGDILDFDEKEWGNTFIPEMIVKEKIIGDWGYCGTFNDVKSFRKIIGNIESHPNIKIQKD